METAIGCWDAVYALRFAHCRHGVCVLACSDNSTCWNGASSSRNTAVTFGSSSMSLTYTPVPHLNDHDLSRDRLSCQLAAGT